MKKLFSIVLALALMLSMTVMATPASAAISNVKVTVTNPLGGALGNYTISFTMQQPLDFWSANYIDIGFPAGTGFGTITEVTVTGTDSALVTPKTYTWILGADLIVVPLGNTLRISFTGAGAAPAPWDLVGGTVTILIEDVTHPGPGSYDLCVGTSQESAVCSDATDADVVATYELTMALDPAGGGTATDMSDKSPYEAGTVVSVKAEANAGYRFVNWTATPEVVFDNANAPETTFTMPDEAVTVTANFVAVCQLTISSTTGGSVIAPGEGKFTYDTGQPVSLVADPDDGCRFVEWTGDVATINDLNAASTTVITDGDYSITANFEEQEEEEPPSDTTGGCFIATAAYGTPTAQQIDVLREFRDVVLLESAAGSRLVALYYQLGPRVADFIAGSEFLRTLVKELLVDPLVWTAEVTGAIWRG
jgi:hypothetical protein